MSLFDTDLAVKQTKDMIAFDHIGNIVKQNISYVHQLITQGTVPGIQEWKLSMLYHNICDSINRQVGRIKGFINEHSKCDEFKVINMRLSISNEETKCIDSMIIDIAIDGEPYSRTYWIGC